MKDMTTLKQMFEEVCKAYATSEEKKYLYYEAVEEWLQQERTQITKSEYYTYGRLFALDELLEKLE